MYTTIESFVDHWNVISGGTRKIMNALTQESLGEAVGEGHRNLKRIAWHIVTTIPEMAERTGLKLDGPKADAPMPDSVEEIREAYDEVAASFGDQVEKDWSDADLMKEDDMYGQQWKRAKSLMVIIDHEIHHRGQMTVLMRQAGLKVPGTFGPSKEEWANYGAPAPEI
ncbi:MAG: DinB family protein [Candidatus Zixiibacteriota bacterium]